MAQLLPRPGLFKHSYNGTFTVCDCCSTTIQSFLLLNPSLVMDLVYEQCMYVGHHPHTLLIGTRKVFCVAHTLLNLYDEYKLQL